MKRFPNQLVFMFYFIFIIIISLNSHFVNCLNCLEREAYFLEYDDQNLSNQIFERKSLTFSVSFEAVPSSIGHFYRLQGSIKPPETVTTQLRIYSNKWTIFNAFITSQQYSNKNSRDLCQIDSTIDTPLISFYPHRYYSIQIDFFTSCLNESQAIPLEIELQFGMPPFLSFREIPSEYVYGCFQDECEDGWLGENCDQSQFQNESTTPTTSTYTNGSGAATTQDSPFFPTIAETPTEFRVRAGTIFNIIMAILLIPIIILCLLTGLLVAIIVKRKYDNERRRRRRQMIELQTISPRNDQVVVPVQVENQRVPSTIPTPSTNQTNSQIVTNNKVSYPPPTYSFVERMESKEQDNQKQEEPNKPISVQKETD